MFLLCFYYENSYINLGHKMNEGISYGYFYEYISMPNYFGQINNEKGKEN